MPEVSSYAEGTPNWVDLTTTDVDAAKSFYSGLFGWKFDDMPVPGGGGVYSMAKVSGHYVAAVAPQPPPMAEAGAPPVWQTYIAVDDADATTGKVEGAGGTVMMPPTDIGESGRMSVIADPGGAAVGLWQAGQHIGATLIRAPGSVSWNELITGEVDRAAAFYRDVVGIHAVEMEMPTGSYYVWHVGEQMVGGLAPPMMEAVPNHWHVYFEVDNTDESVDRAKQLGAFVVVDPFDIPTVGRMATLTDPQGGVFSVMHSFPPES